MKLHNLHNHNIQGASDCELCTFKSTTTKALEAHKKECHVLVHCTICDIFVDSRILLRKHSRDEHSESIAEEDSVLIQENSELKEQLRILKDDFERLSDIYKKQQDEFNEQKLIIEVDLAKTREGFKLMKTENEELKVKNETLFKLGNIALKKFETNENNLNTMSTEKETIEIVDDDNDNGMDVGLEELVKNKAKGFRRTDPTAPPSQTDGRLYSQVAANRSQGDQGGQQQRPRQAPREHQEPQNHKAAARSSNNSNNRIKYCHYFNNGFCHFEAKYGRKCIFSHEKAPICSFDGKCNRKKCMFSHEKRNMSSNIQKDIFLEQRPQPQNITLQAFLQQVLGTMMSSQTPTQQYQGWQRRAYK